jgi:hypothetical protein
MTSLSSLIYPGKKSKPIHKLNQKSDKPITNFYIIQSPLNLHPVISLHFFFIKKQNNNKPLRRRQISLDLYCLSSGGELLKI